MDAALFLRFSWWLVERHEEPSQYPQSPGLPKKLKKINKNTVSKSEQTDRIVMEMVEHNTCQVKTARSCYP